MSVLLLPASQPSSLLLFESGDEIQHLDVVRLGLYGNRGMKRVRTVWCLMAASSRPALVYREANAVSIVET